MNDPRFSRNGTTSAEGKCDSRLDIPVPSSLEDKLIALAVMAGRPRAHPVCRDCTPSYQLRMKRQGRCEHPETMFAVDRDGAVVGVMA